MENIFKWFVSDEKSAFYNAWFVNSFECKDFDGVDKVLFSFLEYAEVLNVTPSAVALEAFLSTEAKAVIKSENIRIGTIESYDYKDPVALDEAYKIISNTTLEQYNSYMGFDISQTEFPICMYEYMRVKKATLTQKVMANYFPKLTGGESIDVVVTELSDAIVNIDEKYNVARLSNLDYINGRSEDDPKNEALNHIMDTSLPCLDAATGGLFTKQIHTMTGQPGAGKTRFMCTFYVYQALVKGIGVYMRELELSSFEVKNMLVAHHIVHLFGGEVKIPDSVINKGKLTKEQSNYVEAARIDLFESGKYGKFMINCDPLYVETVDKEIRRVLKFNGDIKLIAVDYAGIMKSKPMDKYSPRLMGHEIIREGYTKFKEIAKSADVGFMVLNQYNGDGIQAARFGKPIIPGHVEGGQFVQRHSDFDFVMTMTEEQEMANLRSISTVKKRAATAFYNVQLKVDLSVSIFNQLKKDATI